MDFTCLGDLIGLVTNCTGENEDSPLEFYMNGKHLIIDTIVSDETGTVGIYLKEERDEAIHRNR